LQAARPIRAGERLVEIPRRIQFWDLDALRDDFVREELLEARHRRTNNPLCSGAFLAAWLALQINTSPNNNSTDDDNLIRQSYLQLLPSFDDLSGHPILWPNEELVEALGGYSMNYAVAQNYREMVDSEYEALTEVSTTFGEQVSAYDYLAARINVLTRSFSPGPVAIMEEDLDEEELDFYKRELNIDFSQGCHAMVPILDLLNHHPHPNVVYTYNKEKRAFVISAKTTIHAGWELQDSYGKFTDSHLFAKFGFVNGDGSGYTQASIALFHRMLDLNMNQEFSHLPILEGETNKELEQYQRRDLRRYLQYDDGYEECIAGPESHPLAFDLKKLKLDHLLQGANDAKRWVIKLTPRSPGSAPIDSSAIAITEKVPEVNPRKFRLDFSGLVETCRLLSLITSDYDGEAIDVLTNNLGNSSFVVERGSDALEYRALMWYVVRVYMLLLRKSKSRIWEFR
jgi:hypothetical protein